MSYLDVYIGDLNDPTFHWDGGDWNGNVPTRLSPFFPDGSRIQRVILDRISSGAFDGKQTDWGGHVARVTRQQLKDLLDEQLGVTAAEGSLSDSRELRDFVNRLNPRKLHALVCTEL